MIDLSKMVRIHPSSGCWIWQGATDEKGYAALGGKRAHRRVYAMVVGDVPPVLHHRCENRLCVFPGHMKGYASNSEHLREEHPDHGFAKGHLPWNTGRQLIEGPVVFSGKQRRRLYPITCQTCGGPAWSRRRDGKFCSVPCSLVNARSKRS